MLGELTVGKDPDCNKKGTICAPKTTKMNITSRDQIIVHDDFTPLNCSLNKEKKNTTVIMPIMESVYQNCE